MSTATLEAEMFAVCGSPIEQSMLRAIMAEGHRLGWFVSVNWLCPCKRADGCLECTWGFRGCSTRDPERAPAPGETTLVLHLQWEVGPHRVDFLVRVDNEPAADGSIWTAGQYVIECDGHEAHSTREQRTADAQRDRYLVEHGYRVLRFTGSEIWRNAAQCASEALRILQVRGHRHPAPPTERGEL